MFKFLKSLFSSRDQIQLETNQLLKELRLDQDHRFSEIKARFDHLELALKELEHKLITKDIRDKQAYGQLYYKLHEVKPSDDSTSIERSLKKVKN